MSKLKVGDVVGLNSGGPKMTVVHVGPDTTVITASWFHENSLHTAKFEEDSLIKREMIR